MSTERDTHFAGFAKLVWTEIQEGLRYGLDTFYMETLIAQRAYDLVYVLYEQGYKPRGLTPDEIHMLVAMAPDLTTWPEVE